MRNLIWKQLGHAELVCLYRMSMAMINHYSTSCILQRSLQHHVVQTARLNACQVLCRHDSACHAITSTKTIVCGVQWLARQRRWVISCCSSSKADISLAQLQTPQGCTAKLKTTWPLEPGPGCRQAE